MTRDPLSAIEDAPLFIVPRVLDALRAYRAAGKFAELRGDECQGQRARLTAQIDKLTDRLLIGVEQHPTRFWVINQCQKTLKELGSDDASALDRVGTELEKLMNILGIDIPEKMLSNYVK